MSCEFEQILQCYIQMWNSQKRFVLLVKSIASLEEQLEPLRQQLNQQPLFNIQDLFNTLASDGTINAYDIQMLARRSQAALPALESMIKMYSSNESVTLNKDQLGAIFTSRKNHIIARLVLDRPSYGLLEPEIKQICVRVFQVEIAIHEQIMKFRSTQDIQSIIEDFTDQIYLDIPKLQLLLQSNNIHVNIESFIQYINFNSKSYSILAKRFIELFSQNNCKILKQYLAQTLPPKNINPLIDARFQNLLPSPKTINCFNHRQKRSIQSHLTRINCKRRHQVYNKLDKYRKLIEDEVTALVKALKGILYLQKQIQYSKMELSLCTDFYPRLFFESYELDKQGKVIPSTMKHHLHLFNLEFELSQIYHLFKRYAGEDGKLTYLQFQSIFVPFQKEYTLITKNNKVASLNQISVQTKKMYLEVLSSVINNEKAIDKIKADLYQRQYFDIRNIFNCLDNDEDGCISILDFQVIIKKYTSLELNKHDMELLARRFNKPSIEQTICYSEFVLQLTPRSPIPLSKCKSCQFLKPR